MTGEVGAMGRTGRLGPLTMTVGNCFLTPSSMTGRFGAMGRTGLLSQAWYSKKNGFLGKKTWGRAAAPPEAVEIATIYSYF